MLFSPVECVKTEISWRGCCHWNTRWKVFQRGQVHRECDLVTRILHLKLVGEKEWEGGGSAWRCSDTLAETTALPPPPAGRDVACEAVRGGLTQEQGRPAPTARSPCQASSGPLPASAPGVSGGQLGFWVRRCGLGSGTQSCCMSRHCVGGRGGSSVLCLTS